MMHGQRNIKLYHTITGYRAVSLSINPRISKHVGNNRNYILIYKIVYFIGLCCIIILRFCLNIKNPLLTA
jgi:hypothetical protein